MLLGFLAGAFGFFSLILALPFALCAYFLLAYQLAIIEWFADLPFASLTLPPVPAIIVFGLYAAYGLFLFRVYKRP